MMADPSFFLSCLRGSERFLAVFAAIGLFLSCLLDSELSGLLQRPVGASSVARGSARKALRD